MGDPKFPKKTYSTPRHPWQKERIDSEKEILAKFGLKNKRELWKGMEMLKSFRSQARDLQARMRANDPNATKQFQALIQRLGRYSILSHNASLDDVLSLTIEDILSRRLQTIVFRKNLARTPKQARQMITHGHVTMNGRRVTVPGMLVEGQFEETVIYHDTSPFTDDLHPIRQVIVNGPTEEEKAQKENGEETPEGESKAPGRPQRFDRRGPPRQNRSFDRRPGREGRPRREEPKLEKPKVEDKKVEPVKEEKPKVEKPTKEEPAKKEAPVKVEKPVDKAPKVEIPKEPAAKKPEPVKEKPPAKEDKEAKAKPEEVKAPEPKKEVPEKTEKPKAAPKPAKEDKPKKSPPSKPEPSKETSPSKEEAPKKKTTRKPSSTKDTNAQKDTKEKESKEDKQ